MNGQARIVLRDSAYEKVLKIQEATGKGSLTEVVNDLIHRYGQHYVDTWVMPSPVTLTSQTSSSRQTSVELSRATNLDTEVTGI